MGRVGAGAQAVAHLRLVQRGQVLLGHLLHEHAVVALRRHARVRKADDGAKLVHAQVALPATALAARRRGLLLMHHIKTHTSSLFCYPAATLLSHFVWAGHRLRKSLAKTSPIQDSATDRRTGSGNLDMLTPSSDCFFDLTFQAPTSYTAICKKNAKVPSEIKQGTQGLDLCSREPDQLPAATMCHSSSFSAQIPLACNTLLCTHLTPTWSELQLICGMGNTQSADELLLQRSPVRSRRRGA